MSSSPNSSEMPEAVDHARHDVAALVVGAEPVAVADRLEARELVGGGVAIGRPRRPRRRRRKAQAAPFRTLEQRVVLVDGAVGVADRRPKRPAVGLDLLDDQGVPVVGDGEEPAELRFRIVDQHGHQHLALVADEDRPVVGDELGEQAQHEQSEEDPEAPIPAAVGLEILPAPLVDRRAQARWRKRPRNSGGWRPGRGTPSARPRAIAGAASTLPCAPASALADGVLASIHRLRPPGSRSRCADRRACRRNRRAGSPRAPGARRCRGWRTRRDNRG